MSKVSILNVRQNVHWHLSKLSPPFFQNRSYFLFCVTSILFFHILFWQVQNLKISLQNFISWNDIFSTKYLIPSYFVPLQIDVKLHHQVEYNITKLPWVWGRVKEMGKDFDLELFYDFFFSFLAPCVFRVTWIMGRHTSQLGIPCYLSHDDIPFCWSTLYPERWTSRYCHKGWSSNRELDLSCILQPEEVCRAHISPTESRVGCPCQQGNG